MLKLLIRYIAMGVQKNNHEWNIKLAEIKNIERNEALIDHSKPYMLDDSNPYRRKSNKYFLSDFDRSFEYNWCVKQS